MPGARALPACPLERICESAFAASARPRAVSALGGGGAAATAAVPAPRATPPPSAGSASNVGCGSGAFPPLGELTAGEAAVARLVWPVLAMPRCRCWGCGVAMGAAELPGGGGELSRREGETRLPSAPAATISRPVGETDPSRGRIEGETRPPGLLAAAGRAAVAAMAAALAALAAATPGGGAAPPGEGSVEPRFGCGRAGVVVGISAETNGLGFSLVAACTAPHPPKPPAPPPPRVFARGIDRAVPSLVVPSPPLVLISLSDASISPPAAAPPGDCASPGELPGEVVERPPCDLDLVRG